MDDFGNFGIGCLIIAFCGFFIFLGAAWQFSITDAKFEKMVEVCHDSNYVSYDYCSHLYEAQKEKRGDNND